MLYLHCLAHGGLTYGKALRKQASEKVRDGSQKKFTLARSLHLQKKTKGKDPIKGVRKDIFEMPVPIHIEHLKDYPVAVPVKEETAENVLHVHIHDSEFDCFVFCVNGYDYLLKFICKFVFLSCFLSLGNKQ